MAVAGCLFSPLLLVLEFGFGAGRMGFGLRRLCLRRALARGSRDRRGGWHPDGPPHAPPPLARWRPVPPPPWLLHSWRLRFWRPLPWRRQHTGPQLSSTPPWRPRRAQSLPSQLRLSPPQGAKPRPSLNPPSKLRLSRSQTARPPPWRPPRPFLLQRPPPLPCGLRESCRTALLQAEARRAWAQARSSRC